MRKLLVASLALAFAVSVPTVVMAASGGFGPSSLDLQASEWTTSTVTTFSTTFRPIAALSGLNICALNQVTATFSAELSGAPAQFEILVDFGPTMLPGAVRFVPAGAADSFSFTFVRAVSTFENNDHHMFEVEWRSPSGAPTTLQRGTLNLQYQRGTHSC